MDKKNTSYGYEIDKDAMLLTFIMLKIIQYSLIDKKWATIEEIMKPKWFLDNGYSKEYVQNFIENTLVKALFSVFTIYNDDKSIKEKKYSLMRTNLGRC